MLEDLGGYLMDSLLASSPVLPLGGEGEVSSSTTPPLRSTWGGYGRSPRLRNACCSEAAPVCMAWTTNEMANSNRLKVGAVSQSQTSYGPLLKETLLARGKKNASHHLQAIVPSPRQSR